MTGMLADLAGYGIVTVLGLILSVLGAVTVATGRKVNPGLVVLGVGLAAIGGAASAWWWLPGDVVADGAFGAIQAATLTRLVGWFGVFAAGMIPLLILAAGGAAREPREFAAAGAGVAGVALVVLVCAVAGWANGENGAGLFFYVRAVEYAFLGLLVAVAMLGGGGPEGSGRHCGAAAGLIFMLIVSVSETSGRALTTFFLLMGVTEVEAQTRETTIQGYLALTDPEAPWMVATVVTSMLVGALGVGNAARDDRSALAGLVWLALPPVIWFAGRPTTEMIVAASATIP